MAEAFNMKDALVPNPSRTFPDYYHARLGLKLADEKSKVYAQLSKIQDYATENQMKVNSAKCKFILFNPTLVHDFVPDFEIQGNALDTMEEMKLLGLTLRNDLKWRSNTDDIVKRAYAKLWMIKRLKNAGANHLDLVDVYIKQIRSILEFGVPVWNSNLTKNEVNDIERVQKSFLQITLGKEFENYETARKVMDLETLESRRNSLCTRFAAKAAKDPKHKHWFVPEDQTGVNTRSEKFKYKTPLCRLKRYQTSPIPYLTSLLNA